MAQNKQTFKGFTNKQCSLLLSRELECLPASHIQKKEIMYDPLKPESVKDSVVDSVPKKFTELNIKAFERGLEAGKNAVKEL